MPSVSTIIEIKAAPEVVRAKFLDFTQLPSYHPNGFFKSLEHLAPKDSKKKTGVELEAGDKMRNVIELGTMEPVIKENTPQTFSWCGSLPGIFTGEHSFHFTPSTNPENKNGTTFVQKEEFSGILSFVIGEGWAGRSIGIREKTLKGFKRFNEDLKAWCEK